MAEPGPVRVRELRLRAPRRALAAVSDSALVDAVRRGLPAHLDSAAAGALAAEVVRRARQAASNQLGERS